MLTKLNPEDFDIIYQLMEASFPTNEYRTYAEERALLWNPLYSIYVIRPNDGEIKAFSAVWDLGDFAFVEHLAVNPQDRNSGLGAKMLAMLSIELSKPMCLEVELPDTELAARRIAFYERNGFHLNLYDYIQPSISVGREAIPLLIMTSGGPIDVDRFEAIRERLYRIVYTVKT